MSAFAAEQHNVVYPYNANLNPHFAASRHKKPNLCSNLESDELLFHGLPGTQINSIPLL
jgi:hypothetical protein